MRKEGKKRFLNPHLPACPTFMSLFSDCDNEFSEGVCCNFCSRSLPNYGVLYLFIYLFLPNFGVVRSAHMHVAGVKMFPSLSYFIVSSAYIFSSKKKWNVSSLLHRNFEVQLYFYLLPLFFSHTVTHIQKHKSLGAQ